MLLDPATAEKILALTQQIVAEQRVNKRRFARVELADDDDKKEGVAQVLGHVDVGGAVPGDEVLHPSRESLARDEPGERECRLYLTDYRSLYVAQVDEIALMQQWLRDRGQPVPEPHPTSHGMHEMMPGMLSAEQFAQLQAARGAEFDRLFLTLMIQHHRGAVAMVERLFGSYGAGQDETVFKFASDVNVDQTTEIARMERFVTLRNEKMNVTGRLLRLESIDLQVDQDGFPNIRAQIGANSYLVKPPTASQLLDLTKAFKGY